MKTRFYLHYALRSLWRSGQRTLLAMICVAFGVMSLVSMQILTEIISETILLDPRVVLGGDATVEREDAYLTAEQIAQLDQLRAEGKIREYSLTATRLWQIIKPDDTGHAYFVVRTQGVDPDHYPMVGQVTLREPKDMTLAEALAHPGTAAITRDLSRKLGLDMGDSFTLTDEVGGVPTRLYVAAVIQSTPDLLGDKVVYSLQTASQITRRPDAATGATLIGVSPETVDELVNTGWFVSTPETVRVDNQKVHDVFDFMLKGAGILGLLVGGIGVANTMQVLLARRTTEIAMLKTMGYRQRDLIALFGVETALLGLAGSLLGAGAAILFSIPLTQSLERMGSMLFDWSIDPVLLVEGMLAGIGTTLIFGVYAILRASGIRPSALLRDLPFRHARWHSLATGLLLVIPFWLLTSTIMGSPVLGAGVIGVAIAGLIVLGLVLGVALFVMVRLPLPRLGRIGLARNNLRRQQIRTIFALCALFVGVFAIGFSANTILNAQNQFTSRSGSIDGTNLAIFASTGQLDQVNAALAGYPVQKVQARYQLPLLSVRATGSDGAALTLDLLRLEGRETPWDLDLSGDPWGSMPDSVYLPYYGVPDSLPVGSTITITTPQGESRPLTLAGTYTLKDDSGLLSVSQGAVVSKDLLVEIGGTDTAVTLLGEVSTDRLRDVTTRLGRALPDAIVFSAADLRDMVTRMLKNLLIFAVVVAGLALAAGVALIANSVGLAMYERRREMGILKAVGFSSRDVLGTLLLEHGLLGFLAGFLGIIGVAVAIAGINMAEARAGLEFEVVPGLIVVAASTLLAMLSAGLVAWQPVRLRPLIVLRDE